MHTTFHLKSAQELNSDILDAIKAAYQSKSITIIVEEDETGFELSPEEEDILDQRLAENEANYLSGEDSVKQLQNKYGL